MIAYLRSSWISINSSYWFYPSVFSLITFLLSFVTIYIDRQVGDTFTMVGWTEPAGARAILTTIAGSMIGIASTVFSITIAAVAYASGNYGPRLLTNFMEDKGNQLSLATFIATFVYAVMILRVVRGGEQSFVPNLSLLVATVLLGVSVLVLVYFLHHIPASIRINAVLEGIGKRLIRDLKVRFPNDASENEPHEQLEGGYLCELQHVGYISIIDFDSLDDLAEKHETTFALQVRTGDFVCKGTCVLTSASEIDVELERKINDCFSIGSRSSIQEIEYYIDELVEIALRALSPGINDPFTAVTAMHWLTAALGELASRDMRRGPEQEKYTFDNLQPLPDNFEHFVARSFGEMRTAVASSPMASEVFLQSLEKISDCASSKDRCTVLREEGERLIEQVKVELGGPANKRIVHHQWAKTSL